MGLANAARFGLGQALGPAAALAETIFRNAGRMIRPPAMQVSGPQDPRLAPPIDLDNLQVAGAALPNLLPLATPSGREAARQSLRENPWLSTTVGPTLSRLLDIPDRLTAPVQPNEAVPLEYKPGSLGRGPLEERLNRIDAPSTNVGASPSAGLVAKRALGEAVLAPLQMLGEPYMQTAGRVIGALFGTNRQVAEQVHPQLETWLAQHPEITPDKAEQYRRAVDTARYQVVGPDAIAYPGIDGFQPTLDRSKVDTPWQAFLNGREYYEDTGPDKMQQEARGQVRQQLEDWMRSQPLTEAQQAEYRARIDGTTFSPYAPPETGIPGFTAMPDWKSIMYSQRGAQNILVGAGTVPNWVKFVAPFFLDPLIAYGAVSHEARAVDRARAQMEFVHVVHDTPIDDLVARARNGTVWDFREALAPRLRNAPVVGKIVRALETPGNLAKLPGIGKAFQRTDTAVATLMGENALMWTAKMLEGRAANEAQEILLGIALKIKGLRGDQAALARATELLDKYAPKRVITAAEAARAGKLGLPVGTVIGAADGDMAKLAGLVIEKALSTAKKTAEGAERIVISAQKVTSLTDDLLKLSAGYVRGATGEARVAGELAAKKILDRYVQASYDALNIARPATGSITKLPGTVYNEWQRFFATLQLSSPGRSVRDAMTSLTQAAGEGTLGGIPRNYDELYGFSVAGNRSMLSGGKAAGAEVQSTELTKWWNAQRDKLRAQGRAGRAAAAGLGGPQALAGWKEDIFGKMASWRGFKWVQDKLGGAFLSDETHASLTRFVGKDAADLLRGQFRSALTHQNIDDTVKHLLADEGWRNVPPEYATKFAEVGLLDELQDIARSATTAKEFAEKSDEFIKGWLGRVKGLEPVSINPWMDGWDIDEVERVLKAQGVPQYVLDETPGVVMDSSQRRQTNFITETTARNVLDLLPENLRPTAAAEFEALKTEWGRVATQTRIFEMAEQSKLRADYITQDAYQAAVNKAWDEYRSNRVEAFVGWIERHQADMAPDLRITADDVRAMAGVVKPGPAVTDPEKVQRLLDLGFTQGQVDGMTAQQADLLTNPRASRADIEEGLAAYRAQAEAEAAVEAARGNPLANELARPGRNRQLFSDAFIKGGGVGVPEAKSLWVRKNPATGTREVYPDAVLVQQQPAQYGSIVPRSSRPSGQGWQRVPANDVDEWVEAAYTLLGGDKSAAGDFNQMWDEIVRAYEANAAAAAAEAQAGRVAKAGQARLEAALAGKVTGFDESLVGRRIRSGSGQTEGVVTSVFQSKNGKTMLRIKLANGETVVRGGTNWSFSDVPVPEGGAVPKPATVVTKKAPSALQEGAVPQSSAPVNDLEAERLGSLPPEYVEQGRLGGGRQAVSSGVNVEGGKRIVDPAFAEQERAVFILRDMRRWRDWTVKNWGARYGNFSAEQVSAIKAAAAEAKARLLETRLLADRVGTVWRDAVYFNYADRRNFDTLLSTFWAYPYWYSREMARASKQFFTNPHMLWAMLNARERLMEINNDPSLPDWQRTALNMAVPGGGLLAFPVFANLDPEYSFWQPDYNDPAIRDHGGPAGAIYNTMQNWGPGNVRAIIPQVLGALAYAQYEDETDPVKKSELWDVAQGYAGRISSTTTLVESLTGFSSEQALSGILPQYKTYLVNTPKGAVSVGTRFDQRAMSMEINNMVSRGEITPELAQDVAYIIDRDPFDTRFANDPRYARAYEVFLKALDSRRQARLWTTIGGRTVPGSTLMSWLGGPALRFRTENEMVILQAQQQYNALRDQREALYAQGEAGIERYKSMMRDFWSDPRNEGYALTVMQNKRGWELDEAYAWSVLGRLGAGRVDNDYLLAVGIKPELLTEFYQSGGLPERWTSAKSDYDAFMSGMAILGSTLALPELGTATEWREVRQDYAEQVSAVLKREFSAETLEAYDYFRGGTAGKDYLKAHPEVQQVIDRTGEILMGNSRLAAYYASEQTIRDYVTKTFWDQHQAEATAYARLVELRDLEKQGLADQVVVDQYERENKALLDAYRDLKKQFAASLDDQVGGIVDRLAVTQPAKLPELRTDIVQDDTYTRDIVALNQKQQAEGIITGRIADGGAGLTGGGAPPPTGDEKKGKGDAGTTPADWARQYAEQNRALALAQAETDSRKNGYLTADNRDLYETTLYTEIVQYSGGDPRRAKDMFYATHPDGWKVYEQMNSADELLAYMGDNTSLREAMLKDVGADWTAVAAYVRSLSASELERLKVQIPDVDWVAAHARKFDDGPSESARADMIGVKVTFNIDGSISVSRLSVQDYFGDGGGGSTAGGGGPRRGGGGGGGSGGARAPAVSASAQEAAQVDQQAAQWEQFAQALQQQPSLLVNLEDFLALSDYAGQRVLQRDPNLALLISRMTPEQITALRKAYLSWAIKNGKFSDTSYKRWQESNDPVIMPILRVYPRRNYRSGLS